MTVSKQEMTNAEWFAEAERLEDLAGGCFSVPVPVAKLHNEKKAKSKKDRSITEGDRYLNQHYTQDSKE